MRIHLPVDDPIVRRVHRMALSSAGHEVVRANDGDLAQRLASEGQIDLVISDRMILPLAVPEI